MDPSRLEGLGAHRPHLIPRAEPLDTTAFLRPTPGEPPLVHLAHLPTLAPGGLDLPGENLLEVEHLGGRGAHTARIQPIALGDSAPLAIPLRPSAGPRFQR